MDKLEKCADFDLIKKYSVLENYKSPLLILVVYGIVILLAFLNEMSFWLPSYLLTIFIIAGLQAHLSILLHEAAHGRLHSNEKINDFLGNCCCGFPLYTLLKDYKHFHLNHHRFLGDPEKDPERRLYRSLGHKYQFTSKSDFIKMVLRDLGGVNILKSLSFFGSYSKEEMKKKALRLMNKTEKLELTFFILLIAVSIYFSFWKGLLLYWAVPSLVVFPIFLMWHGQGEHIRVDSELYEQNTFVHEYPAIINFFLFPINSGYHLSHHLFPTVPWYNQRKLHQKLMENPEYYKRTFDLTVDGHFFGNKTVYKVLTSGDKA